MLDSHLEQVLYLEKVLRANNILIRDNQLAVLLEMLNKKFGYNLSGELFGVHYIYNKNTQPVILDELIQDINSCIDIIKYNIVKDIVKAEISNIVNKEIIRRVHEKIIEEKRNPNEKRRNNYN